MILIKKVASDMRGAGIALIGGEEVNKGVVQESQDLGKEGPKGLEVGLRTGGT